LFNVRGVRADVLGSQATTVSWHERLEAAGNEAELVDVARDYVALLSSYEIARLPVPCRPPSLADGHDVSDYAFTLVRYHYDDDAGGARSVGRLAAFFAAASMRLTEISSSRREPGESQQRMSERT
jgi:hypothetical protein